MKSKREYDIEHRNARERFRSEQRTIDPLSLAKFDALWRTLSGAKAITIGLWILWYVREMYVKNVENGDNVKLDDLDLTKIYDNFIVPLEATNGPIPQRGNFVHLNNLSNSLKKENLVKVSGNKIKLDNYLTSPISIKTIEYWWRVRGEGYFTAYKNKADDKEKQVIALNKSSSGGKRACSPDGGVDGIRTYCEREYSQDHKDIKLSLGEIQGLLVKNGSEHFCISTTRGVMPGIVGADGFVASECKKMCADRGYVLEGIEVKNTPVGDVLYLYFDKIVDKFLLS